MNPSYPDRKTMGLRELKRLETHLRIEDKATELFLRRDYDDVTLEEICEAAMVSRRTFFNYFQSKEHVAVGAAPINFSSFNFQQIENLRVPEGSSLIHELSSIVAKVSVNHAASMEAGSIHPELSAELRKRRIELLRRTPSLGMSKLSTFEKTRNQLAIAVTKNMEAHPEHRMLPHRSLAQDARLVVTSTTITLWAASILPMEPDAAYLTEQSVDTTASDFAQIFSAMTVSSLFPPAE